METCDLVARDYARALRSGSAPKIFDELQKGVNINQQSPYTAMDVFISRGYIKGISAVLVNPEWNPNVKGADGLFLIERAMLKNEKLALRIMEHPRFNINQRVSMGRTLAMSAVMLSAPAVFQAVSAYTKPTDKDARGCTLSQYLEEYGKPVQGRLAKIHKSITDYRKMLLDKQNEGLFHY